jgi:hypothetical protein
LKATQALVSHGLLQVAQDLLRIGVALQQARRLDELFFEAHGRRVIELKDAAIETDRGGMRLRLTVNVCSRAVVGFQYSSRAVSCARPESVNQ